MGLLFKGDLRGNNSKKDLDNGGQVERAQFSDISLMLDLWKKTAGLGLGISDGEDSLKRFMQRNPSTCLVLRLEKGIAGTVLGGYDGRRGYVYHLAVAPDYQGRGWGKVLLNRVINELKSLGALKIHLFVFNDNKSASGFYQHLGWELRRDIQVFSWDATGNNK